MIDDADIDPRELSSRRYGDDSTPLVALVHDKAYSRGGLTSQGRTNSESYAAFVRRAQKEFKRERD
jgi:hypothetical protein